MTMIWDEDGCSLWWDVCGISVGRKSMLTHTLVVDSNECDHFLCGVSLESNALLNYLLLI